MILYFSTVQCVLDGFIIDYANHFDQSCSLLTHPCACADLSAMARATQFDGPGAIKETAADILGLAEDTEHPLPNLKWDLGFICLEVGFVLYRAFWGDLFDI